MLIDNIFEMKFCYYYRNQLFLILINIHQDFQLLKYVNNIG